MKLRILAKMWGVGLLTTGFCLSGCGGSSSGSGSPVAPGGTSTIGLGPPGGPGGPAPSSSPAPPSPQTPQRVRFIAPRSVPVDNPDRVLAADFDLDGKLDIAALAVGQLTVYYGRGDEDFGDRKTFSLGTRPSSLTSADFNEDGRPDLAVTDSDANNVKLFLGTVGRTFTPGPVVATGRTPSDIVVGDWNEDGNQDFATPRSFQQLAISLRLGDGAGNFTAVPDVVGALSAGDIGSGDFNADGNADLVVDQNFAVRFYYGNAQAGFSLGPLVSVLHQVDDIEVGDVNNDGRPDVVTNTGVVLNDGQGGFSFLPTSFGPRVALSDQNGDGNLDVATTLTSPSPRRLAIFTGNGTGGFQSATEVEVGRFPLDVQAADFDQDSVPDLVMPTDNFVALASGTGKAGVLTPTQFALSSSAPTALALGDLLGDANPDLFVLNNSRLMAHTGSSGGQFSLTSILTLGGRRLRLVDLNGDGHLDLLSPRGASLNLNRQSFTPPVALSVGSQPVDVQALNFTGGNALDLAVANVASDTVSLLEGDGNGGFSAVGTLTGFFRPTAITAARLNNDAFPDLVVADFQNLHRLSGSRSGFVSLPPIALPNTSGQQSLAVGDLNRDGFDDVVVGNNGNAFTGALAVYLGEGAGGLASPTLLNSSTPVEAIRLADLNADGNVDIVTAGGMHNLVSCYLGDGAGNFTRLSDVVAGGLSHTPFDVDLYDLNGDSKLDMLTADGNRASVSIFYRR